MTDMEKKMRDFADNLLSSFCKGETVNSEKCEPVPPLSKHGKIQRLLTGTTIKKVEIESYKATDDTLILHFGDNIILKIVSDPNNTFEGLSFYLKKTKIVEQEYDDEIK